MYGEAAPPFVGRSDEVQRLRELARTLRSGPAGALVSAEPGLGKTRLLAEVAPLLDLAQVNVHGYEPAREIPLGAAGTLLRELAEAPEAGGAFGRLLLGEGSRGVALEKVRLFEAAFRCLVELAPLAVVVDDLQWADSETLALLHYLAAAARPAEIPLLLLCASRPTSESASFGAALKAVLEDNFVRIELAPLERESGVELASLLAPDLDVEAAAAVWEKAQGSPFWVAALAGKRGRGASPLELIRSRYTGLDAGTARVFAVLLVAAEPLAVSEIAEVLGSETGLLDYAVDDLANRALVIREAGVVRIAHDLIREAASAELPVGERRQLHARLAEWFEAAAGEDVVQLARTLEHRQAASLPAEDLALRITRSPQRRLLGAEALAMLGDIADAARTDDALTLRSEVATLAAELGEWNVAFDRWTRLVDELPDPDQRAHAALAASAAAFRLNRADEVHAFVSRARKLGLGGPNRAIEADYHEAEALIWLESRVSEATPLIERALAAAEALVEAAGGIDALGDEERNAYVMAVRAKLDQVIRRADAEEVRRCSELIQAVARDPAEILAAACDFVFSLVQFDGMPKAAEPHARRAREDAGRLVIPSLEVEATTWVGWIAHQRGRLEEAQERMREAVALAERVGPPRRFSIAQVRAAAHGIEASRSDWRGSVEAIEQVIASEPDPHFRLVVRIIHIWLVGRFASPDASQLRALMEPMADDVEVADCARCTWESVLHTAEAQARIGDLEGAEASLRRWDSAHARPHGGPAARRAYTLALIESHRDPRASLPLFADAAAMADEIGHRLMRLWIDLDAAVARARIDRVDGIDTLRGVAREASAMGALSEHQLALRELRTLGVRTWRRRGDTGPLTRRELEIAHLVAEGGSNPEIAEALFLSRKTVERHVSNILLKLGARNRTQISSKLRALSDAGAHR